MNTTLTTYEYTPASFTFKGGAVADIIAKNLSVRKGGQEIRFATGDDVTKLLVGSGSISFSGVLSVDTTVPDIIDHLKSNSIDITIGTNVFHNCSCRACNISVAGSAQSAVFLQGNISYKFDYVDNDDIPSMSNAEWIYKNMAASLEKLPKAYTLIEGNTQYIVNETWARYAFRITRMKRFDSDTFTSSDLDTNPPSRIIHLVSLYSRVFIKGGSETELKSSIWAYNDPDEGEISWRIINWNVSFAEEGYAQYTQIWKATSEYELIDKYKTEPGAES